MSEQLKPCPSCGAKNDENPDYPLMVNYEGIGVTCDHCGFRAPSVERWNTRAANPAVEVLDEVENWLMSEESPQKIGYLEMIAKIEAERKAKGV